MSETLVLGIGNLLWADEGFGVRTVERFNQLYHVPPEVRLMDGGTQGIYLVQYIMQARRLIIFDAIDYGLAPGSMKLVRDREVPCFMGAKKMSLHQTGFQETLATAELLGSYPQEILLIGVQPEELEDYGGGLTPTVEAQVERAIEVACETLADWGHEVVARGPAMGVAPLSPDGLGLVG